MSKGGKKSTSTTEPTFAPEVGPIFGRMLEFASGVATPIEDQRRRMLGAIGRGAWEGVSPILSPALAAARQAQARLSASMQEMPANVSAPIQEQLARQTQGIPQQLQQMSPEQLAMMIQQIIPAQYGGLFAPGSRTTAQGGGPSGLQTGMAAASTAATIAALGIAI